MPENLDNTQHKPRSNTARRNKAYGFNAEAELLQYLRDNGVEVERLHLAGQEDEGDLIASLSGLHPDTDMVIQLKTWTARSANGADRPLAPATLRKWLLALQDQREHYRAHRGLEWPPEGMLVVKVKGRPWDEALVISTLKDWL